MVITFALKTFSEPRLNLFYLNINIKIVISVFLVYSVYIFGIKSLIYYSNPYSGNFLSSLSSI